MSLPKKIEPCPIADALLEIRFQPLVDPNAVFGLVFKELKDSFQSIEKLSILQLPEFVRDNDPDLKFKPHHKMFNDKYVVQIGPNVISISSFPIYNGWVDFSETIYTIISKISNSEIVDKIERIGLRYINFFEKNIFDNISLKILLNDCQITQPNTIIQTQINSDEFTSTLQIANNVLFNNNFGSVIDIDTYTETSLTNFFENYSSVISKAHQYEKELFFSVLTEEFLKTLSLEY